MPRLLRQISILQVNVGRSWAAHETALQLAYEQHFHAILIQEPWVLPDRSHCLSPSLAGINGGPQNAQRLSTLSARP